MNTQSLRDAAIAGDMENVMALLKEHPDLIFGRDHAWYGWTPLHLAAAYGHKDMAEFLLAQRADVNARDQRGGTPLLYAADRGYKQVAEVLLANKANVNARDDYDRFTPLHLAANNSREDVVELLLANKAEVNARDRCGVTPLGFAASKGHKSLVEVLRRHGGHE
jgi:ankyrin repeat protein